MAALLILVQITRIMLSSLCIVFIIAMLGAGTILATDMYHGSAREKKVQQAKLEARERREKAVRAKGSVTEMLHKEKLRREKEAAAHEGLFEDRYMHFFDTNGALITRIVRVPTEEGLEYYKTMDELAAFQIFDNTEDL